MAEFDGVSCWRGRPVRRGRDPVRWGRARRRSRPGESRSRRRRRRSLSPLPWRRGEPWPDARAALVVLCSVRL